MASDNEKADQLGRLGLSIMEHVRSELLLNVRFLGKALLAMPFVASSQECAPLASDGSVVRFDAEKVVRAFRDDPNTVVRCFLHLVLHCLYRHPFDEFHRDAAAWDAACDVAVEATSRELLGERFRCPGDERRAAALEELKSHCAAITPASVYRVLAGEGAVFEDGASASEALVKELVEAFCFDSHALWPRTETPAVQFAPAGGVETDGATLAGSQEARDGVAAALALEQASRLDQRAAEGALATDGDGEGEAGAGEEETAPGEDDSRGSEGLFEDGAPAAIQAQLDEFSWVKVSEQVLAGLKSQQGLMGFGAETFWVNLSTQGSKRYDYRQFLKRFARLAEEMKTSTEEFDYVYYTYGLRLYENMPLVEPLEYQESTRVREFVIAIDTSASCADELVRRFVEQTYNILKSTEGFGYRINVHIVQCDDDIRQVTVINNVRDLDSFFSTFKASGKGGTDFRPVFRYVDECVRTGEFEDLKGMVYLTDGNGEYPDYIPGYEAVFVFVENNLALTNMVPPWATKVVMDEDRIMEL